MTNASGFERVRERYTLTTDRSRFDVDAIHAFLSEEAYWCLGRPRPVLEKAMDNSLCFGLLEGHMQIGFMRAVTDRATFAWLCDVYILPAWRGRGLARWMLNAALEHEDLRGLRRIVLATRDAHALYAEVGFVPLLQPERWMSRARPDSATNADAVDAKGDADG